MSQNASPHIPKENRAEFFRALFTEQKEKGLSLRQLAEAKDIRMTTLNYWLHKLRKQDGHISNRSAKTDPSFVEVKRPFTASLSDVFVVEFPNGIKLQLPSSYPTDSLVSLLRSLSC